MPAATLRLLAPERRTASRVAPARPVATLRLLAPETWAAGRVVVVVAHPDDEVLGCGALLATLKDVRVVEVTNGAPRSGEHAERAGFATRADYAAARRAETLAALSLAGIPATRLVTLDIDDQAAPEHLAEIARRLIPHVADADLVLTHAYEGGHGDHDATAFATHAALRLLPPDARPALVEMPFYHAAPKGWTRQRFLPRAGAAAPAGEDAEVTWALSPEQRDLKARMIAAHRTQAATLRSFPLDAERFRLAPHHDFARRPHDGDLLYERHGWSLTWPAWQAAVQEAAAELGFA